MSIRTPPTLLELAGESLLRDHALLIEALEYLPAELFPLLFTLAYFYRRYRSLKAITKTWPFTVLPLGGLRHRTRTKVLKTVLDGLDVLLTPEVRSRRWKLRVLDLRYRGSAFWRMWLGDRTQEPSQMVPVAVHRSSPNMEHPLAPVEVFLDLNFNERNRDAFFIYVILWAQQRDGLVHLCCKTLRIAAVPFQRVRKFLDAVQLDCIQEVELKCTWDLPTLGAFALYMGQMRNLQRLFLSHIHILNEEEEVQEWEEQQLVEEEEQEREEVEEQEREEVEQQEREEVEEQEREEVEEQEREEVEEQEWEEVEEQEREEVEEQEREEVEEQEWEEVEEQEREEVEEQEREEVEEQEWEEVEEQEREEEEQQALEEEEVQEREEVEEQEWEEVEEQEREEEEQQALEEEEVQEREEVEEQEWEEVEEQEREEVEEQEREEVEEQEREEEEQQALEEEEVQEREEQEEQISFSQFLSQMLSPLHLRELDLGSPSFLRGRLHQMLRCLQTPLEKLTITHCRRLTHSDLTHLFQCPKLGQLKSLRLYCASLADFSPVPLQALLEALTPTLQELCLDKCAMVDSQVEAILPVLSRCHQLSFFTISENRLSLATVGKLLRHTAGLCNLDVELYPVPLECYTTQGTVKQERLALVRAELTEILRELGQPRSILLSTKHSGQREYYDVAFSCQGARAPPRK